MDWTDYEDMLDRDRDPLDTCKGIFWAVIDSLILWGIIIGMLVWGLSL